ncbi:hypothetical protein BJ165DRAFT_818322 [Panaeolus papilionaceus]|nr:hypothetical protein BJ165DRAFT_818322 [Panaeolus papilionaceus]
MLYNDQIIKKGGWIVADGPTISTLLGSQYPSFKRLLRNAMGLEQHAKLFDDLYDTMEERADVYFDNAPTPSIFQYTHLVEWLARAFEEHNLPLKYEHFWPIRVYLSKRTSISLSLPQFTEDDQDRVCSELFLQDIEKSGTSTPKTRCPTSTSTSSDSVPLRRHTCPELAEISENLQKRMVRSGLSALLPMLAIMGLKRVQDFDEFCACPATERLAIMKLSSVHVSDLESFVLGVGLESLLSHGSGS